MMKNSFSFCIDDKMRIVSWGKKVAEITGLPEPSVRGLKYDDVLPSIYDGQNAVATALKKNSTVTVKGHAFRCFSGHIKADITFAPLKSTNGGEKKLRVTISSPLNCPQLEKFQFSQRLMDIGKIASTFAHGLRNHLNVIKGINIWLKEKYHHDPSIFEFANIMEEEISHLDVFVSKFLSTSLSDANPIDIDINASLRKIEVLTSLQLKSRKIEASYDLGNIPIIKADPFHLEQAILNIFNNALEAMPHGGHLTVRTSTEKIDRKASAAVEISDTGSGIMDKNIRNSETISNVGKEGRGFGLFITREILHYYGGQMEIVTNKGSGTTVKLVFPCEN
jgi:two-component system nitrogen regulation sensor histidine kinase GlnL